MAESTPLQTLLDTLPQCGRVEWIGIRPARGEPMQVLERATATPGKRLDRDRLKGRDTSKRQMTLIQKEHLHAIASCLQREAIEPDAFRRNDHTSLRHFCYLENTGCYPAVSSAL